MRYAPLLVTLLLAVSCGPPPPLEVPTDDVRTIVHADLAPLDLDGHRRLGDDVIPKHYTLEFDIVPWKDRFSGTTTIEVDVKKATPDLVMHGHELRILSATATVGDKTLDGKPEAGKNGALALRFDEELPVGKAVIEVRYDAELDEVPVSIYRVEVDGKWYVYTQFEPLEAREAFPGFDEPRFKTPFDTTIRVPRGVTALSNGPEKSRENNGETTVFTFKTTAPLPTYLVALAVGDFDIVTSKHRAGNHPIRLVATSGKGELGEYALEKTAMLLRDMEKYFDQEYPFQKLDLVAVPNFSAGAMENVGLVTFRQRLLLYDDRAPERARVGSMATITHELAHMWFGNLVTMPWWDDIWLNEAFATWMTPKIMARVVPEYESLNWQITRKGGVMSSDAQKATRAIRQPIVTGGDVYNAFDGITYAKGASVLQMLETWTGEEPFRQGLKDYMKTHAGGNATTADLFAALDKASGKPVGATADRFTTQPGTPLVAVELACDKKAKKASLKLSQTRYLPKGSDAPIGEPWSVPVCVHYGTNSKKVRHFQCVLLDAPEKTVELDEPGCPAWVYPNANENGYYRFELGQKALLDLVTKRRKNLTLRERIALPNHLQALLEAGKIDGATYMKTTAALGDETHWLAVGEYIDTLEYLDRTVDERGHDALAKHVRKKLAPHYRKVANKKKETAQTRLLRPQLRGALAWLGRDAKLRKESAKIAQQFIKDPTKVDKAELREHLRVAAWDGDQKLWTALRAAFDKAKDPVTRRAVLTGLGNFSDKKLITQSLDLLLDGTLRAQDYWSVVGPTFRTDETHAVFWDWFTTNYRPLIKKLGEKAAPRAPWAASGFCSADGKKKAESFFVGDKLPTGGERNLALALEGIDRCVTLREHAQPGVYGYLKVRAKK